AIYLVTLPWGLVKDFDWWTVPVMGLITYFMLGVETIAEEIEDPFGDHDDDLKLDEICRTIERSVREIMNEPASLSAESLSESAAGTKPGPEAA
ncbi:MAG: hypothetical protein MUF06_23265, partial [Pirellulaceae bacterium]|nr:hypothetical protein [Pirellulaceae bacterium]